MSGRPAEEINIAVQPQDSQDPDENPVSSSRSPSPPEAASRTHPVVCRELKQFETWQQSRAWLSYDVSNDSVKCTTCVQVKHLGLHKESGQHSDNAFINGTVRCKNSKTLLKKIDKHRDSLFHKKCLDICKERGNERLEQSVDVANSRFVERHKDNIDVTGKIFRTVYECVTSHLSCSEHPRLVELQSLNGINCGNILYSHHACSNITSHIADEMRSELVHFIKSNGAMFSIMVDESTSVSNVQSIVVYLRTRFDGKLCTYFLGLLPLTIATAAGLEDTLLQFLNSIGLSADVLSKQFIGFCSDGASCMIGQHRGVATLLKIRFPQLKTFHCMAHRLELAVKNAVDTVNLVSRFKMFVDELYKVYSMSPKNQRELEIVAKSLSVELMRIQRVFDVRWAFSSFISVKAVLRDFGALYAHFSQCASPDSDRASKEKSKYIGLVKKLQSWSFVSETCMLKDALRCIKQLSLYLQSNAATIFDVMTHIDDIKQKFLALKQANGKSLDKFCASYECDQSYKGVCIEMKAGDRAQFDTLRCQFFQALHDNFEQRFPSADFLKAASCINRLTWPKDPLERALFGESCIAKLCKDFAIDSNEAAGTVVDYAMFKQSDGVIVGKKLQSLINLLEVLPVSSADCERGFSQMNLYHTSGRNRLSVSSVNDMMMIGINGPPLAAWNSTKYVISWLKSGKHGALDKATGLPKKAIIVKHSSMLFGV